MLGLFRFAGALFHPVEVLAAALAICMLVWTAGDLARASSSARWEGTGTRSRMNRGRDYRLSYLTKLLGEQDLGAVHQVLTTIVDRTLVARYGVSRAADPVRSREILGADVHDFLSSPPRSPYDYHRRLPGVLTRIEAL